MLKFIRRLFSKRAPAEPVLKYMDKVHPIWVYAKHVEYSVYYMRGSDHPVWDITASAHARNEITGMGRTLAEAEKDFLEAWREQLAKEALWASRGEQLYIDIVEKYHPKQEVE